MCGAPASTEAARCEHCGARLATVACPSCFGMMFVGAKFCSHCGAAAARAEAPGAPALLCPGCRVAMEAVVIGKTNLRECPRCEGIWADVESLERICADREDQAAVLGFAAPLPVAVDIEKNIRYVPCPVCNQLMNRVNFAQCSHVVVDVCRGDGTWFDKNELQSIVEFIRSGGLEKARSKEMADLEEQRRLLSAQKIAGAWDAPAPSRGANYEAWGVGIAAAAAILRFFLKK